MEWLGASRGGSFSADTSSGSAYVSSAAGAIHFARERCLQRHDLLCLLEQADAAATAAASSLHFQLAHLNLKSCRSIAKRIRVNSTNSTISGSTTSNISRNNNHSNTHSNNGNISNHSNNRKNCRAKLSSRERQL
ncbi:unnamed protein product, partial [Polarella glacialis]